MLWSSTPIFAPLAAMARAVAAPRPEPPPVMRTATSFNCMGRTFPWGVSSLDSSSLGFGRLETSSFGCRGSRFIRCQHAAADQRFHVLDILAANLVGHRTDTGGARHRVAAKKQMVAGADQ